MDIIKTIPDKIYVVNILEDSASGDSWGSWSGAEVESTMNIEYIRKDALLEWLNKTAAEYKKRSDEGELVWQNWCAYNDVIEHLNSM